MPTYKVKKGKGLKSLIKKTDFSAEFTLEEVKNHYSDLEKAKKELESKVSLERATRKNIETNYPKVKKLSEELLQACFLYVQSKIKEAQPSIQLSAINKALKNYDVELEEIKKQTGIDIWK